ncbi:hypothetical protein EV360DRAFT_83153 [Lentinula raphanica]|nr:hypothetical protein EV360DRAFT_83153 [Lentinula raphanica]
MYLGNILLQLIVGATLFPATNPLPTPPAPNPIPTGPIQIQLWQRIPQPWPHDAFKAWRRDQLRVLDSQQDWLQLPIGGVKCRGYDENNLVFWNGISDTIQSLKLVKMQGVSLGGFNLGVYNVTQSFSLPGDPTRYSGGGTYLVKLVDITKPTASCEPYALQKFNIWHRTGIQVEGDKAYGAILLKRELGTHLAEDERWKTSSSEWKKQYLSALESIMRNIVYHLFFMTPTNDDQLGPIDFHPGNVRVQTNFQIKKKKAVGIIPSKTILFDFRWPGVYRSKKTPSNAVFIALFSSVVLRVFLPSLFDALASSLPAPKPLILKSPTLPESRRTYSSALSSYLKLQSHPIMFLGAISLVLIGATFVSAQDPDNPPQIWEKLKDNWPQKQYEEWLYMKVQENNDNHREWLYKPEKCPGYDQNELRFHGKKGTSAIQKLTLGGRRDVQFPGKHSVGVFDVVEPVPKRLRDEANEHVLKVVDISDKSASCEPYALEQFGVWHRTGIRHGQLAEVGHRAARVACTRPECHCFHQTFRCTLSTLSVVFCSP